MNVAAALQPILDRYDLTIADLRGPCRLNRYVHARRAVIRVLRAEPFSWSLMAVGDYLDRDASTILHHERAIAAHSMELVRDE